MKRWMMSLPSRTSRTLDAQLVGHQAQPHRLFALIFIAEIPSTLNEALLLDHLLKQNPSPEFRPIY